MRSHSSFPKCDRIYLPENAIASIFPECGELYQEVEDRIEGIE
ncbi:MULTISPECIES: hypothetical protein [Cyanophyceae]|nr:MULTISPECIES: hypothetical protein [unclassified Trichocoleus]